MPTIHAADARSRALATEIAKELVEYPTHYKLRRGLQVDVQKPRGADDELVIVAGPISEKQRRSRHYLAISIDVTRNGKTRRIRAENTLSSRGKPTERDRFASLAGVAAHLLAPYFKRTAKKTATRKIHVDAYHAQSANVFRNRIVRQLAAQGFRTRVTLGLSDIHPDPACWGYLQLPFVDATRGALTSATGLAGGHKAKTTIRAKVAPDLSEDAATKLLADKLVAWYGKLAAIACD